MVNDLANLESTVNKKLDSFDGKLGVCEEMVRGIATLIKMKKSAKIIPKPARRRSIFSESPERERPVAQNIQDYEERIEKITNMYEAKIRDLEKESSKNGDTCQSSARERFTKEANEFESLLLARDN